MEKISIVNKFFYGLGFVSRGIMHGLFQLFLFFYFSQVLGLDAKLAGLASLITFVFDAITDPLVGVISDKWTSKKWGRRHPFMLVSALPLGVFTYLLFAPPAYLNQMELFWWLTGFSVLIRIAITFFDVPARSLGAELSTDYKERTVIISIRMLFDASLAPMVMIMGYTFYFVPTTDYSNGLLNKAAYPSFALLCAILMSLSILISTLGTRNIIPKLPQISAAQKQLTITQLLSSLGTAIKMPSFISLVLFITFLSIALGVGMIISPYFAYYFGISAKEMAVFPISSIIGDVLSLFIAPRLGDQLDKKWAAIWAAMLTGIFFSLPCNLRMLGLFPENDSPYLLTTLVLILSMGYTCLWIAISLGSSMMADVIDEFELLSTNRQEGLFFSILTLASKMTTGIGAFIAGLLLSWIAFPTQTDIADVSPEAINDLGLIGGPINLGIYLFSMVFLFFYPITKERYREIRVVLDARKVLVDAG